jgi:hypothetical protein
MYIRHEVKYEAGDPMPWKVVAFYSPTATKGTIVAYFTNERNANIFLDGLRKNP